MIAKLTVKGDKFVADVNIPTFDTPPKGIAWGNRHFFLTDTSEGRRDGTIVPIYEEGLLWSVDAGSTNERMSGSYGR